MSIKHFILIALLFTAGAIGATNTPISAPVNPISQNDGGDCDLPAPFFVQIDAVGTTWITFSWGGNTAYQHQVQTFLASNNTLLNTTLVPAGTLSATINGLPSGTGVYAIVNAVCDDGTNSPNGMTSPVGVTLIADLIIQQFTPDSGNGGCSIAGTSGSCAFSGNGITTFKIYKTSSPSNYRYFGMKQTSAFEYEVRLLASNSNDASSFDFFCANGDDPNCYDAEVIRIFNVSDEPPTLIGWFSPENNAQINYLTFTKDLQAGTNFTIQHILPQGRSSEDQPENYLVNTAPNPFSNTLDVLVGNPEAENIHLQMFDLSGRAVLDRQFAGGQQQYSLPTENLANGFYLLRAEVDGKVETLKVIKSE